MQMGRTWVEVRDEDCQAMNMSMNMRLVVIFVLYDSDISLPHVSVFIMLAQ